MNAKVDKLDAEGIVIPFTGFLFHVCCSSVRYLVAFWNKSTIICRDVISIIILFLIGNCSMGNPIFFCVCGFSPFPI